MLEWNKVRKLVSKRDVVGLKGDVQSFVEHPFYKDFCEIIRQRNEEVCSKMLHRITGNSVAEYMNKISAQCANEARMNQLNEILSIPAQVVSLCNKEIS